jgi:hypothetical integral membrane protein (TIGR02206 family)
MGEFFAKDYAGEPFQLFGPKHLIALGVILLINLSFILVRRQGSERLKKSIRYTLAGIIFLGQGAWHVWSWATGTWTITYHLPLHLCAIFTWVSIYMLLTKDERVYDLAYFLGVGGALQVVITPEAGVYGLPHFRAVQTLTVHGAIVTAGIYMTVVEGYRPFWTSFKKVFLWLNGFGIVVTGVNLLLGSNYLYTLRKPETASLIDFLGPWPWYLLVLEVLALAIFLLMYLPFWIRDRRARFLENPPSQPDFRTG